MDAMFSAVVQATEKSRLLEKAVSGDGQSGLSWSHRFSIASAAPILAHHR